MERRDVVGGGLLGLTALLGASPEAEAAHRGDNPEVSRAIDALRQVIERRLDQPVPELRIRGWNLTAPPHKARR